MNITENEDVSGYLSNHGIKWTFVVQLVPWMGGFYERLIGLVKRSIRKELGKLYLYRSQLETITIEIEAILNSRPLTYVGDDLASGFALTPAHFLTLNTETGIHGLEEEEGDPTYKPQIGSREMLLNSWSKGQRHLERFWKLWQDEYLLALRERYQTNIKSSRITSHTSAKQGDIVLIKEDLPRGLWKC